MKVRLLSLPIVLAAGCICASGQTRPPVLISEANSTRAIVLESVYFTREPFAPSSLSWLEVDRRTRIVVFALNLTLQPADDLSAVTADAEDGSHKHYNLRVEYVGKVPGHNWMSAVILRLSDDLTDVGDVLLSLSYKGNVSNRVRVGIGHIGGGLPDDTGAAPTPAPPYTISGQVTEGGKGFGNTLVTLSGSLNAQVTTDNNGLYSFTVNAVGDYTVTPSKAFYEFTPPSVVLTNLTNSRTGIINVARRQAFTVSGQVTDENGKGVDNIALALMDVTKGTTITLSTSNGGNFSFENIPAGFNYIVTPANNDVFTFTSQSINALSGNLALVFKGTRRSYNVTGKVTDENNQGLEGIAVTLLDSTNNTTTVVTTSDGGNVTFANLAAGFNYTITPANNNIFTFTPQGIHTLSSNLALDFKGTRRSYNVTGKVTDENLQGLDGITLTLARAGDNSTTAVQTSSGGNFSFSNIAAGFNYTITPANNDIFTFTPQSINALSGNLALVFKGTRRSYNVTGKVTDENNQGLEGIAVTLMDSTNNTTTVVTTSDGGNVTFDNLAAGFNYTITPANSNIFTFTPQGINTLNGNLALVFKGTRRSYNVTGKVTDENLQGLDGITLTLARAGDNSTTAVQTSSGGNFSFSNIAAGFNYTLTPANNSIFTFTPQSINTLSGNRELVFKGTRRSYAISGQVTNNANQGLAGVTIDLSSGAQTLTDDNGNYSFASVPAGFGYVISAAKTHYILNPQTQNIGNLQSSPTINFNAVLRKYAISGRVMDSGGQGLFGIAVALSGTEIFTTRTDAAGNYSFLANALGNYVVTPSIEQDYYVFTPGSQQLTVLSGDQSVSFSGILGPVPNPSTVLEFDGSPKTVDYGYFWSGGVDLGHFFWEFWAMPGANAGGTYLLSDGYGGAHALLFGFGHIGSSEPGRYRLFGNTFDGVIDVSHITFFASDQGPAMGEWGHFAVGWDGQNVITYFNGVPVGKAAFAGPRRTPGTQGGGKLLIGGSDHNNLIGRIAQVRGYEGSNPRAGGVESSFAPQTVFGVGGNLLSYYFRPAPQVADLSNGFEGQKHVGTPRGTTGGVLVDCGDCPPPQFVFDNSAPDFGAGTPPTPVSVASPGSVPAGARVFDSFGRVNSTYIFGAKGGLGSTEGGSAGQQVWQVTEDGSQRRAFGILNGVGVLLGNGTSLAWVPTGSVTGNLDVRVNRRPGQWGSGISTGVGFRVVNHQSYFFAYTTGSASGNQTLTMGYYLDGVRTDLASGLVMPSQWTTIKAVTTNSGTINIFADNVLVSSTNSPILATATGAGLYNDRPGLGLVNRWDNFAVFNVP